MFDNLRCYASVFRVQKQTVASDALFRRLGRDRKRVWGGATKEIIFQEMKTRLSQKLQKTNSPKMTHKYTHENTHKYPVKQRHTQKNINTHTHLGRLSDACGCLQMVSGVFTLFIYRLRAHTDTHRLLLFLAVRLDWLQMDQ